MSSPSVTRAGRLTDAVLPPALSIRLRARVIRPGPDGTAPHPVIVDLVPKGATAVDVGAHRGLWTYWIGRRAGQVHSFEPNPNLYAFLSRTRLRSVHTYQVALSDVEGTAELSVPTGGRAGRGSIEATNGDHIATVATRRLDSYALADVGFMKIDVEGHEEAVIRGATETLERCHPVLVIEIEDRHNPGATARIPATLAGLGYQHAYFERGGTLYRLPEFDLRRHQIDVTSEMSDDYVNNFVFMAHPLGEAPGPGPVS
ncbi:MAG TPA: FkbM family methyltransferase [Acidimicrobiales bacterium]|jgi:FkbM family methyltransferase